MNHETDPLRYRDSLRERKESECIAVLVLSVYQIPFSLYKQELKGDSSTPRDTLPCHTYLLASHTKELSNQPF
jgi:hypothetical protein